jgi:hypothetical protein
MQAKDVIKTTMDFSDQIVNSYLNDLSDADLMLRPVEGMNHIAWQLGHLISAERMFVEELKPGSCPPLPAGFDERHNKDTHESNDAKTFATKDEYLRLWKQQRTATKAALESISEADLDKPGPERFRKFIPTVGAMFNLVGTHALMHAGQFVGVRRKLKKPITM